MWVILVVFSGICYGQTVTPLSPNENLKGDRIPYSTTENKKIVLASSHAKNTEVKDHEFVTYGSTVIYRQVGDVLQEFELSQNDYHQIQKVFNAIIALNNQLKDTSLTQQQKKNIEIEREQLLIDYENQLNQAISNLQLK